MFILRLSKYKRKTVKVEDLKYKWLLKVLTNETVTKIYVS